MYLHPQWNSCALPPSYINICFDNIRQHHMSPGLYSVSTQLHFINTPLLPLQISVCKDVTFSIFTVYKTAKLTPCDLYLNQQGMQVGIWTCHLRELHHSRCCFAPTLVNWGLEQKANISRGKKIRLNKKWRQNSWSGTTKPHWAPCGCEGHPTGGLSGAHALSSVITTVALLSCRLSNDWPSY